MKNTLLVLGATSDIARAVAHRYASEGWDILLAGRKTEILFRDAADLRIRYGVNAEGVSFQALDLASHQTFWSQFKEKPDGVLYAIGYLGDQIPNQSDWAESKTVLETNFTAAVSILNIIAEDFEARRSGFIIGISSVAGDRGRMSNYIYGSAKAGFTSYLSGLRNRLSKKGVQVMTVKPGFVATKMTEGKPLPPLLTASPKQVANDIFKAYRSHKPVVYSRWYWKFIMLVIVHLPERLFMKLSL